MASSTTGETDSATGDLLDAVHILGIKMSEALPFSRSLLARMLGARKHSARAVILQNDEGPYVFKRAWLDRPCTRTESESPIRLLTDTVEVDPYLENQKDQFADNPRVAAVYDPDKGVDIKVDVGTTLEEQIALVKELGDLVVAIALTKLEAEVRDAVPVHDL